MVFSQARTVPIRKAELHPGSDRPSQNGRPGAYRWCMDQREQIKEFLASRRARITPEQAGVPTFHGTRRVPGLRREEVAHLAGVSVDYYTRIERGKIDGASLEVLEAIARALQLDDVERDHLMDLVQIKRPKPVARRPVPSRVPTSVQQVLDSITVPAVVQNAHLDLVAANTIAKAVYSLPADDRALPRNNARFTFLDPQAAEFYRDWESVKRNTVALLRAAAGRDPYDQSLINLVGQLSTQSGDFRQLWAAHDVLRYRAGTKRYHHRIVGDIEFGFESFGVASDPSLTMLVYTVEPHSPTADAMALLASWIAPATKQSMNTSHDGAT